MDDLETEFSHVTRVGNELSLEFADPLELIYATAKSSPTPANGLCAVELKIADAERTADDESFTWTLMIPAAGGPVTGKLAHVGNTPKGTLCTVHSDVTGTFTRSSGGGSRGSTVATVKDDPWYSSPEFFPSLGKYCERVMSHHEKDCDISAEHGEAQCECTIVNLMDVSGPTSVTSTGGKVRRATLVRLQTPAEGPACQVAIETGAGWIFSSSAFPCHGAGDMSGSTDVKIRSLRVVRDGKDEVVELIWDESNAGEPKSMGAFRMRCRVPAGDEVPTCTPRSPFLD